MPRLSQDAHSELSRLRRAVPVPRTSGNIRGLLNGGLIVGVAALASSAFGGNPAEELAKLGSGSTSTTPVDHWASIEQSFLQIAHPGFIARLFLGMSLAVICSGIVGWHPRRPTRLDPLTDLEERKALIILGVVGAIVAELTQGNQALAFVIFGIGALLRFRTVLDNPKITGKAITVVVIGLACGMGQWAMAIWVTAFTWCLLYWLESHMSCRIKIRLEGKTDPHQVYGDVQSLLVARHCRLRNSVLYEGKRQMVFMVHMPSSLDPKQIEEEIRGKLPRGESASFEIRVV